MILKDTVVMVNGKLGKAVENQKGLHVAVRIAGERRVDEWHVSQVEIDPT